MPSDPATVLLVKLPRELADALRCHAEAWQVKYARGENVPGNPDGKLLSLQAIIRVLLERDQRHRKAGNRKRKHKYQG